MADAVNARDVPTVPLGPAAPADRDGDPLALVRAQGAAIAGVAFGRDERGGSLHLTQLRHLALLPMDALDLDLADPTQRVFGDYELLELIGEGGMGVVYRARQISLDREVAVKLLAAGPWASRDFIERFKREAQNAARMQHPNIVAIYEVGSAEELHFFSMRLVRGISLAERLHRDGPLDGMSAARLMRTIAEALAYAHSLGVLHLDLKPANILLDEQANPHIADFGLARRIDSALAVDNDEVSGTPAYMSPEQAQIRGQKLSPATDIWGLGVILYELVCGQPPFRAASAHETIHLVLEGAVHEPRRIKPGLSLDLQAIIMRCVARDPSCRYESARALADDLGRFIECRAVRARPLNPAQRLARWIRREPKFAVASALAAFALIGGLAATTHQWRRAEDNAATSNERLWQSRREAAMQLEREGAGFAALTPLVANIVEEEQAGRSVLSRVERREVGMLLGNGVALVDRMRIAGSARLSPFAVELSPDGSILAVTSTDLTVRWFNTRTKNEMGRVDLLGLPASSGNPETPVLLRFVDNHRLRVTLDWIDFYLAPGESDTYLIDLDAARLVQFPAEFADFSDATFSADGNFCVLRNRQGEIQLWQVKPWRPLSPLEPATLDRENFALSRDGRLLFGAGNKQRTLAIYDSRTLGKLQEIKLSIPQGLSAWAQSSDGKYLALGGSQGEAFLFDLSSSELRNLPTTSGREVTWLSFSEDDAWLAAVRADGSAFAIDVASGHLLHAGQMNQQFEPRHVSINHRERLLIASGGGHAALWRLAEAGPAAQPATLIATSPMRPAVGGPYSVAFCAATGMMVSAETDGEIRFWRAPPSPMLEAGAARQLSGELEFNGRQVADVAFDRLRVAAVDGSGPSTAWLAFPDAIGFAELIGGGSTLVVTSGTELSVIDVSTMQARHAAIDMHGTPMRLVASAASGIAVVAFPDSQGTGFAERIRSYDLGAGRQLGDVVVKGPLRQLELSPDGLRLLATATAPGETAIYDARRLSRVRGYVQHPQSPVVWAGFGADSSTLHLLERDDATITPVGRVVVWNAATAQVERSLDLPGTWPVGIIAIGSRSFVAGRDRDLLDEGSGVENRIPAPTRDEVTAVLAVSHDGRVVAHAFRYEVQLYDADSGAAIGLPLQAGLLSIDAIAQLAFSPGDDRLLARTLQGRWLEWPIAEEVRPGTELARESALLNAGDNDPTLADTGSRSAGSQREQAWSTVESRPQPDAARIVEGAAVPVRAAGVSPFELDLGGVYTSAPDSIRSRRFDSVSSMGTLPIGQVRIDDVDYDVRGAVELHPDSTHVAGIDFISRVGGIAVPPQPIAAFNLLMLSLNFGSNASGTDLAHVRVHYRGGETVVLPLRAGAELPGAADEEDSSPLGWAWGDDLRLTGYIRQLLLSNPRLVNPHPERLIDSVDLEAVQKTDSHPVFFALTAEPVTGVAKSVIEAGTGSSFQRRSSTHRSQR